MLPNPVQAYSRRRVFHRSTSASQLHRRRILDIILSRSRVTNLGLLVLSAFAAVSVLFNLSLYFRSNRDYRHEHGHQQGAIGVSVKKPFTAWGVGGYATQSRNQETVTVTATAPSANVHLEETQNGHGAMGILSTISRPDALGDLDHLVVVPGHAIWEGREHRRGGDQGDKMMGKDPEEWVLEAYQGGGGAKGAGSGRVSAFVEHVKKGAEIAQEDGRSLLVFSGGQTRRTSTTTEAESYMRLALLSGFLQPPELAPTPTPPVRPPPPPPVRPPPVQPPPPPPPVPPQQPSPQPPLPLPLLNRTTTEDHAVDSLQNLLFSIARFHEYTGRYPVRITIVGYEMKRRRFVELHRKAVRWPESAFEYVGIDPEGAGAKEARRGEHENGYQPFLLDTYGCHPPLLAKRQHRNPFMRFHSYYTSAPEIRALMDWCPGTSETEGGMTKLFEGSLPWDHDGSKTVR